MLVHPWDGEGDYRPPVRVGDRVRLRRAGTLIESTVVRTEGYAPNVVELEFGVRLDLVGWDLEVLAPFGQGRPSGPDATVVAGEPIRWAAPHGHARPYAPKLGMVELVAGPDGVVRWRR